MLLTGGRSALLQQVANFHQQLDFVRRFGRRRFLFLFERFFATFMALITRKLANARIKT